MKFIFSTLLAAAFLSRAVLAQDSKIAQSFITKTSVVVYPYSVETQRPDKSIHFLLNDGIKFYVYKVLEDGYILSVWDFNNGKNESKLEFYNKKLSALDNRTEYTLADEYYKMTKRQVGLKEDIPDDASSPFAKYKSLAYVDYWGNNMLFFMPLKDFSENCESIHPSGNSFTWGFLTLPIKTRFGNDSAPFTFEENINFGLSFGWKFQRSSKIYSAHNFLAGISVSRVTTNPASDKTGSASTLSFSGGYMYQYELFQIGGFLGIDLAGDSQRSEFRYHGKPWLGIAIGVSLFGERKTSGSKDQKQNK